jgi:SAM-dependent methyltransferase
MTSPRLEPPFWQHDAYTLRRLATALRCTIDGLPPSEQAGSRVAVDLGAGDAPYRPLFEAAGYRYLACDIDGEAELRIVPGQPLPLADRTASLVLSFQVLEHVWDLDEYLGEARRLLADDGRLVLSTHGTWLYHPHPTDFRRWTRSGLQAELSSRGFVCERTVGLVGPLAWTTQFRAIGAARLLRRLPFVGALLSGALSSLYHLRMLIEDAATPSQWIDDNAAVYLVQARKAATP